MIPVKTGIFFTFAANEIMTYEAVSEVDAQTRVINMQISVSSDEVSYMKIRRDLWYYRIPEEYRGYVDSDFSYTLPWWVWIIKPSSK